MPGVPSQSPGSPRTTTALTWPPGAGLHSAFRLSLFISLRLLAIANSFVRSTQTRSRGFPNLNMPPGSNEKSQGSMGSGFPGSNLYPNKNIWTSSLSNARERSIGAKGIGLLSHRLICFLRISPRLVRSSCIKSALFWSCFSVCGRFADNFYADNDGGPSGSGALAANSEADVWGSNPWKAERPNRSVSTSPNRTRDATLPNGSSYFDHAPSAIGMKKGSFGSKPFQDDATTYGSAFASQKRGAGDPSYMDPLVGFPQARDSSLPPSRQSQGSPAYQEMYRGHTPSNSMHSSRNMANSSQSYSTQSANQRAFNLNKQIDDDLLLQFGRRVALDTANTGAFNPSSQPFQFNPGSQPWMAEGGSASRYGGSLDLSADPMASQYASMKRGSVDRISPASSYRLESGNSPRDYAPSPEGWSGRPSSREPRGSGLDRRGSAQQQFGPGYAPSYYPNQYPYANLAAQYPPNFLDPYTQNFRHPMLSGYGLPPVHSGYPIASNLPPIRPSRDQDPGKGVRSVLLDEFRLSNKSSKRYELKDIYNYVVEFSGDQHGSRFIQQKLETANSDEKDQVFREIEPNAIQLMKDVFGNYVVQKFFEHGNQVQKKVLAEKMKGKVVDLSVQVYACRVVQKVKVLSKGDLYLVSQTVPVMEQVLLTLHLHVGTGACVGRAAS